MQERAKEDKMQGGGGCEKNLRGRYAGEGKEDKMRGVGVLRKKIEGGMPERIKNMKCGGGQARTI